MNAAGAILALALALAFPAHAAPETPPIEGTLGADDWAAYRDRFVMEDGRVVDDANGGISHSEGQGYGLILAFAAGDRGAFERIFGFTRNQLLIRDDGLASWKWDPDASPNIVDVNNATDGDILIAYGLALAGKAWNEPRYTEAATRIARAIGENLLASANGRTVLKPGIAGFAPADRPDGAQVVNPSYWVYEAFPVLKELAPEYPWDAVADSGVEIARAARFGDARLPPDWVAITPEGLVPAEGFPAVFGYNAIRIPLYLVRAGYGDDLVAAYAEGWREDGPAVVELASGRAAEPLADPGYRMVEALAACAGGTPVPPDLLSFAPTAYYPSTLHLLGLSYLASRGGACP